jgi:AcrR family transcriptional regulator
MHFVPESATTTDGPLGLREQKRWQTSHRISVCAQQLTDTRGLDGFTMDELAEVAGVSRRTLFNYFPGKLDAVLGATPEIPADDLAEFQAGGPHGHLLDDLGAMAQSLLTIKEIDRDSLTLARRVLTSSPRLIAAAHERFEQHTEEFVALLIEREGKEFGSSRARLLIRILLAIFDASLDAYLAADDSRPIDQIFDEQLRETRALLA